MPTWRPRRRDGALILLCAFSVAGGVPTAAAQVTTTSSSRAALFFAYEPHDGMAEQFHDGYRRHLEWHRNAGDSLIWYGWEVLIGKRIGVFIDGTFGRPFQALDARVDPAGDGADFAETAGRFADPLLRAAYVLREDLSTGTPLERGEPTPTIEAVTYRVRPGRDVTFEAVTRAVREMAAARRDLPTFTWYELVNGASHPTYLLLIHGRGLSAWDRVRADLSSLVESMENTTRRDQLLGGLADAVAGVQSELWRYLPASSLIPVQ